MFRSHNLLNFTCTDTVLKLQLGSFLETFASSPSQQLLTGVQLLIHLFKGCLNCACRNAAAQQARFLDFDPLSLHPKPSVLACSVLSDPSSLQ